MTATPSRSRNSSEALTVRPKHNKRRLLLLWHYSTAAAVATTAILEWLGVQKDALTVYTLIAGLVASVSGFAASSVPTSRVYRLERELRVAPRGPGISGETATTMIVDGRAIDTSGVREVRLARETVRWIRYWVPGYHLLLVLRTKVLLLDTFRETGEGDEVYRTATAQASQLAQALGAPFNQDSRDQPYGLTLGLPSHALTPWLLPGIATFALTIAVGSCNALWQTAVSSVAFVGVVRLAVAALHRSAARLVPVHDAQIAQEFMLDDNPMVV